MRTKFRRFVDLFKRTPFHPQWLFGREQFEIDTLHGRAIGTVLDIGCSDCWVRNQLPSNTSYIGLDYPVTGIEMYQSRPDVFADASELPFENESIDTVVLFQTLEHIARPEKAISEIFRVLRPGGILLLTVPFLYPLHDEPYDFTRFTNHGLVRVLEDTGFSIETIKPSLGSAQTTGLIVCLNLAGMSLEAVRTRSFSMVFVPFAAAAIPFVNLGFWLLAKVLPSWSAIPAGFQSIAVKSPVSCRSA